MQALIEAFIRDNVSLNLPNSFRHSIHLELLHKLQQGWDAALSYAKCLQRLKKMTFPGLWEMMLNVFVLCVRDRAVEAVCHQLCVCNAVRDALEGRVLSVSFYQLLQKSSENTIRFLLEVHSFYHSKTSLKYRCRCFIAFIKSVSTAVW